MFNRFQFNSMDSPNVVVHTPSVEPDLKRTGPGSVRKEMIGNVAVVFSRFLIVGFS